MGNLHNGHMTLIDNAKSYNFHVTASIFINPLQFNDASDFKNYPKSLDDDIGLLSKHGCDSVFIPDSSILENIKEIKALLKYPRPRQGLKSWMLSTFILTAKNLYEPKS